MAEEQKVITWYSGKGGGTIVSQSTALFTRCGLNSILGAFFETFLVSRRSTNQISSPTVPSGASGPFTNGSLGTDTMTWPV
jgi:hypothetical protein